MPSEILLVIPCFRERDRLPRFLPRLCETLTRSLLPVSILVVDDGSGIDQAKWLDLFAADLSRRFPLLRSALLNAENQGKGGAVYSGWKTASSETWVGFVDADGAVSAEEVSRLCKLVLSPDSDYAAVYAVRTGEEGTIVRRQWRRSLSGRIFRSLVQRLFKFPVPDTQCGCKFVRRELWQRLAPQLEEVRYCFDVELTFRILQSSGSIGIAPIHWEESPGSRLGLASAFAMGRSLYALKRRLGEWR